jgi:hypothetical protein
MKTTTIAILLTLHLLLPLALAQSTFGTIVGAAVDATGAAVAGATITVRNVDENTVHTTTTGEDGSFQFLNLKAGRYELVANASGFSDFKIAGIQLDARQDLRLEVKFQVAQVGETVQVSGGDTAINTENATISASKNGDEISQLPLNYRGQTTSPLTSIIALPSVQSDQGGNIAIGGAMPSQVGYSVDGVSTASIINNASLPNIYPSTEIVSEVKVSAFNNNAEFAQVGDVTFTTKSGGNDYHGSVFEYMQDSALDATVYGFDTKPPKNFNTFGGSFSGPVVIPGLYDGHNRTFFFVDYEGNRRQISTPFQFLVPTAAERAGNLSGLTSTPIINPATGQPFPGNVIPSNLITQTSRTLLDAYYPLPNNPGNPNANLFLLTPTPSSTNGYDVRIDQALTAKQSIYGRWSWKDISSQVPNGLLPSDNDTEKNRSLAVSHNYAITPTVLNEFRFGLSRYTLQENFPIEGAAALAQLDLTGLNISDHPTANAFPSFNFSAGTGFASLGRDKDGTFRSNTTELTDNLTWTRGKHTLKFGADFRHVLYYTPEYLPLTTLGGAGGGSDDFGLFNFGGNFTGNAFSDFLLGAPTFTYQTMSGPDAQGAQNQYAFYAQDEWRLTARLTLNFGLRYGILPPFIEKGNNLAIFDPATGGLIVPDGAPTRPALLESINTCGTGPNGDNPDPSLKCVPLTTASQAGLGQGLRKTYYGDYQPRLSFAYRPFGNDKTVIRGGFGIYTVVNLGQFSVNSSNDNVAVVRVYTNANPVTGAPRYQFPNALYQAPPQDFVGSTNIDMNVPSNWRDPQSAQWNLTVERELPLGLVARVSYLGMNTYRMQVTEDLNQVQPSTLPYNPALKPYPNWGVIFSSENAGFANYQAMQVEVDRRLKNGLSLQASYMLQKNLSDYQGDAPSGFPPEILYGETVNNRFNLRDERGNVEADPRQRFLLSGTYELPIGAGKRLFANAGRLTQGIFGGWQVSTIALIETGPFLTPTYDVSLVDPANLNAFDRGAVGRPDRIGNGSVPNPTPNQYFNINAFTAPPVNAGRIGNSGVGILVGPGTIAISGGLAKNFSISERFKLRFEATVNNLPNHPNFAPPAVDVSTPSTFGITSSVQTAENAANRTGQLALRLVF